MPTTLHNEAAIAGIGQTAYSKNSGVSELQLATEAVRAAIDDAGIHPSEVDGLVTYTMDSSDEVEVARTVGIGDMTYWSQVNYGGGAAVGLITHAAMAVATGQAKNVVVYRALNGRSGQRMGQGVSGNIISSDLIHWSWYMPFGLLTPASWIALQANLYMEKYGATSEHLAHVAITQRMHAQNNPNAAMYGKPMTMDDYMCLPRAQWPIRPAHGAGRLRQHHLQRLDSLVLVHAFRSAHSCFLDRTPGEPVHGEIRRDVRTPRACRHYAKNARPEQPERRHVRQAHDDGRLHEFKDGL